MNTSHLILFANPLTLDAPPPWWSFRELQGICESIKGMAKVPSEDSGKPTIRRFLHLPRCAWSSRRSCKQRRSFSVSTSVSSTAEIHCSLCLAVPLCGIPRFYLGWIPSLLRSPIAAMALDIPGLSSSAPLCLSHHFVLCQHCQPRCSVFFFSGLSSHFTPSSDPEVRSICNENVNAHTERCSSVTGSPIQPCHH